MSERRTTVFDVLLHLALIFCVFPLMLILIGMAKIADPLFQWYSNHTARHRPRRATDKE